MGARDRWRNWPSAWGRELDPLPNQLALILKHPASSPAKKVACARSGQGTDQTEWERTLHDADDLRDLFAPPGNRLEALHGEREGQYSIRINDQYRVCFKWEKGKARDVEIVDYHK